MTSSKALCTITTCSGLHKPYGTPISLNAIINSLHVCLSLNCAGSRPVAKTIDNYVLTTIKMLMQFTNKVYNFQAQTCKPTQFCDMSSLFRSTIFHCKFKDLVSCHKINCHQDGWVSLTALRKRLPLQLFQQASSLVRNSSTN